ncbi:MAG: saccharopine dehydrogenase NADP-binding domain-containing protein [Acidobacteriia bacterium]|nr:saccharopine dehydrogenase NADP-binding domain-containing protein [Terriglobia bacterium]
MKLLVIGAGMMGSAAAYDMAREESVESVTLADADKKRAKDAAARINKLARNHKVRAVEVDAGSEKAAAKLMRGHDAALSAVPYFFNLGLARAAVEARCHFADLGGNNTVVREEFELDKKAAKRDVAIAPDCGLSPGMASILAGELMRRIGGEAGALKIYVGGLPQNPKPPFNYQLMFSVEGLINEYAEPAKILRKGKIVEIEPLSEAEVFRIAGFPPLEAFHTSGGTSTLPETFRGRVGECFEKTLRYPGHLAMLRALYDLGLFSKEKRRVGKVEVGPRELMAKLFEERFAGMDPDVTIMRVEAHEKRPGGLRALLAEKRPARVLSFTLVDHSDARTGMTSMMRTTAWPASIIVQMLASGDLAKRGALRQETEVPAEAFLSAMARRGIQIQYEER